MERLIKTLNELTKNRRLSSECEEMIGPFLGETFDSNFSFKEASTTFASRLGDEYKGGKTVVAQVLGTELGCSILFPESENEWVRDLKAGDDLDVRVKVLEFDNLYQRVVFGQTEEDLSKDIQLGEVAENISQESKMEESDIGLQDSSIGGVMEGEVLAEKPEITKEQTIHKDKMTADGQSETVVVHVNYDSKSEEDEANREETVSKGIQDHVIKETKNSDEDTVIDLSHDQLNQKDLTENRKEVPPLLPPSLPKKEAMQSHDPAYLEQLRDKRYEHGSDSLTEEEKEALAQDLKANTVSRQKELKKNKEKVNKGARAFFGFIMAVFSLNACSKGGGFFAFVVFCIGVYLLIPLLKKLKEINE